MDHKILFVDDEEDLLHGFKRTLRKIFAVDIAVGGEAGLEVLEKKGPFSVVVSDYQMPNMNGIDFLIKVKEKSPDTTRVILTGQADMQAAIDAINQGNIFRFLNKPCETETLQNALKSCIRQYELVTAEKLLLEKTLKGSVNILLDVLAIARTDIFSKASRIKQYIIQVYHMLNIKRSWSVELAAMFYFIGAITLPKEILEKLSYGEDFTDEEKEIYKESVELRISLLENIPRLESVIKVIKYTDMRYNEFDALPNELKKYDMFILGAHILKIAISFERLVASSKEKNDKIIDVLESRVGLYNSKLLPLFNEVALDIDAITSSQMMVSELTCKMVLEQDVTNKDGTLLIAKGQRITEPLLLCLRNLSKQSKVVEPIRVHMAKKYDD